MAKIIFIETKENIKNFFLFKDLNSIFEINPLSEFIYRKWKPIVVTRKEVLFKLRKKGIETYEKFEITEPVYIFDTMFIPDKIPKVKDETIFIYKDKIIGAYLKKGKLDVPFNFEKLKNLDSKEIKGIHIENIYDVPYLIGEFVYFILKNFYKSYKKVKKDVYIKKGKLKKGIYLYTSEGPIIIEEIKKLFEPITLSGPLYIGKDVHLYRTFVKNSFLKDVLRLGGEIDSSLFLGYSNKAHEGYIGHSVIGKWVNLGALTTTSDLKNTYSNVRIYIDEKNRIDTGRIKIGAFISNHVQTGIGTLLSSGTIIMPFSNLYGGLLFSGYIKPFTWWGPNEKKEYRLSKAIEVAEKMMKRRNVRISEDYKKLIKNFYNATKR